MLYLVHFAQSNASEIHLVCCMYQEAISFLGGVFRCLCHIIHSPGDGNLFSFVQLRIKLPRTFMSLEYYLEIKLLNQRVGMYLTLLEIAK